jgi:hypothetical protein
MRDLHHSLSKPPHRKLVMEAGSMAGTGQAGSRQLLQAIRRELDFFSAGGYGRQFRSQWRPTLLLRDSPVCAHYSSTIRGHGCAHCPFFPLIPPARREATLPCHHIPLNAGGVTIARLYQKGTQEKLDKHYRDWLENLIREIDRP